MEEKSHKMLILEAADRLSQINGQTFTREALSVEAWKAHPEVFGLKGFKDTHPNVNKVFSCMDGKKGLVNNKLLKSLGDGLYAVQEPLKQAPRIPVCEEVVLLRPYLTFLEVIWERIDFSNACKLFWNSADSNVLSAIENLDWIIAQADVAVVTQEEQAVVNRVRNFHQRLQTRFERHLRLLKNRKEK